MGDLDDQFAEYCKLAMGSAARDLGEDPMALAKRLHGAEIARLIRLLNAAWAHVDHAGLRHRIEDLLLAVTDGRMPDHFPESELDWALNVAGRRREDRDRADSAESEEE